MDHCPCRVPTRFSGATAKNSSKEEENEREQLSPTQLADLWPLTSVPGNPPIRFQSRVVRTVSRWRHAASPREKKQHGAEFHLKERPQDTHTHARTHTYRQDLKHYLLSLCANRTRTDLRTLHVADILSCSFNFLNYVYLHLFCTTACCNSPSLG